MLLGGGVSGEGGNWFERGRRGRGGCIDVLFIRLLKLWEGMIGSAEGLGLVSYFCVKTVLLG